MKKVPLLGLAACLALAGCFQSKMLLLDVSQAAHPLADGNWIHHATDKDDEDDLNTLVSTDFGYVMSNKDSKYDLVVTPLAGHEGAYAVAKSSEGCASGKSSDCEWEYAVVSMEGDVAHQYYPNCKNQWDSISADVASRNEDGDTCWFEKAEGLQHALGIVYEAGHPYDYVRDAKQPLLERL